MSTITLDELIKQGEELKPNLRLRARIYGIELV